MSLANLVRLNIYSTDVDLLFQHYGVLASRLGAAGATLTTTMLGVTRLVISGTFHTTSAPRADYIVMWSAWVWNTIP